MSSQHENRILSLFQEILPERIRNQNIYHYTGHIGMLGIVTDGCLQASSVTTLNDSGEIRHGLSIIKDFIYSQPNTLPISKLVRTWSDAAEAMIDEFIGNSYIVCASTLKDAQPLFLLYGSYSVEFNTDISLTKVQRDYGDLGLNPEFKLGWQKVIYDKNEKIKLAQALHLRLLNMAQQELATNRSHSYSFAQQKMAIDCIYQLAIYFKEESSSHEQEVRLYGRAKETNSAIKFRVGKYGIIPYIEVKAYHRIFRKHQIDDIPTDFNTSLRKPRQTKSNFPILRILIGPGLIYPKTAKVGLEIALQNFNYKGVNVELVDTTRLP